MKTPLLMIVGVLLSASAQLGLRRSSELRPGSAAWTVGMGGSVALYGLAFLIYSIILRHEKVTVAGPVMTVGVVGCVVLGGLLLGETLTLRQWGGVVLATAAIFLLRPA